MAISTVPLREVVRLHYGSALKDSERDETGESTVFGSNGPVGRHREALVTHPTIVIGRKGSVGSVTFAPEGGWPIDTTFYTELIDPERTDIRYLYRALARARLDRHTITTSIPGLNRDAIYATEIPLPSRPEQQRIAAILDKADAIRRKRQETIALTEQLLRSTFLEMFERKDLPAQTVQELLDQGILTVHKDGNHGSQYPRPEDFGDSGVPFLTAQCVTDSGEIVDALVPRLRTSKASELRIGWLENGDVLLAHNATVGRVALYRGEYEKALIGTSLTAFRPNPGVLRSEYLFGALRSPFFQHQLTRPMQQTTRNQVPITAQRALRITIPPICDQQRFADLCNSLRALTRELQLGRNDSEQLFHSLAQHAFRGDL